LQCRAGILHKEGSVAKKVKRSELADPGLLAVTELFKPFTGREIKRLTRNVKKYALTGDGRFFYLWGE